MYVCSYILVIISYFSQSNIKYYFTCLMLNMIYKV